MNTWKERSLDNMVGHYALSSLAMAFVNWCIFYVGVSEFLVDSFFPSTLLVGSYAYYVVVNRRYHRRHAGATDAAFIIFQLLFLSGTAFTWRSFGPLSLSVVPILFSYFYYSEIHPRTRHQGEEVLKKSGGMVLIAALGFIVLGGGRGEWPPVIEVAFLASLTAWSAGLIVLTHTQLVRRGRSKIFSWMRKHKWEEEDHSGLENKKVRLFYHDVVNQTHNMLLFLSHKLARREGVSLDDVEILQREIKALQSIFREHYGFKHKNLVNSLGLVSFETARPAFEQLIKNYSEMGRARIHLVTAGDLADTAPIAKRAECQIHFPSVYRIVTNLVKNLVEQRCDEGEVNFWFDGHQFKIEVKNPIRRLRNSSGPLEKNLEKAILATEVSEKWHQRENGFGLESIENLTEELGGSFYYGPEGDFWVSQVILPVSNRRTDKLAA